MFKIQRVKQALRGRLLASVVALGISSVGAAPAQAANAIDLMREANAVMTHYQTIIADVDLTIESTGQQFRNRALRLMTRQDAERRQMIAVFRAPESVKDAGFATDVDLQSNTRKSWVYFPAVGQVRALKSSNQNDSFFGSDFSYSDIAGRSVTQDRHRLIEEDAQFYTVESTPKGLTPAYSRLITKISKADMTIQSVLSFDLKYKPLKRMTHERFEDFKGVPVVSYSIMENLQTGTRTLLNRANLQVDVILLEDDFGPDALTN
ncbi:MAG: outer membrane lipoprotein-sorting protein [Parvibaculales bacterium]